MHLCVPLCHLQRLFRQICGCYGPVTALHRQADGNAAGSSTEVQKLLFRALLLLKHQLHQCFGVLARDQHMLVYKKIQSHEFLAAQNLLQRNT